MKQRKYFELFAAVGRKCVPSKDFPYTTEALLADMKYARIHGAAILASEAEEYSFIYGNRESIRLASENRRLVSIATGPTTAIPESGDKNYFGHLLEAGVGAFAVLSKGAFHCSLHPKSMRPMVEALINHKRPLIVTGTTSEERYEQVSRLAESYPELPIIMQGTSWGQARLLWEVLDRHENLYFEISSNHLFNVLDLTKKYFGIERALYSSAWPNKSMGAIKTLIEYADLTEEEKDLVAHGNACRLMGLSMEDFPLYDDAECELDEIAREADAGLPISVSVIDSHTHMVAAEDKTVSGSIMIGSDCDSMARKMERLGIDTILTAPLSGISIDGRKGNAEALYAAQKYPGKILGYSTCNVHYDEDRKDWRRYHEAYPECFVGVKPYWPYQKFDLTSEVCEEWFSYANDHHLLLLIHADGSDAILDQASRLSLNYPNITVILAHSGISYTVARKHAALALAKENVVLEITYTSTTRGMIEFLVDLVGADKVLYGSDMPMRDPGPQLGWVCYADISLEEKKKILGGNICRLLQRRI